MPEPATAGPSSRAREVAVPPDVRALSTLPRIDYANTILGDIEGVAEDRTAEQWARAVLEDAPARTQHLLTRGWAQLGIPLGPIPSDQHVLGWSVLRSTPDSALLGVGTSAGLQAELLVERRPGTLVLASFIQQHTDEARASWDGVEHRHSPTMRRLLEEAIARA